jgi:SNF2 family DNA or RNA helicase
MLEDQSFIYEHRDRHFKKLIQEFKTISDAEVDLPSSIDGHLRKYQRDGYRWLRTLSKYGFGGILADEMGLGKTLQTIALLASYYEEHGKSLASCADNDNEANENVSPRKPSLVVVPASLVYNWGEELKRFAPSLNYVLITGSKSEREDIILNIEGYDVAVTSYDLLKRDIAEYEDHSFAIEIIDEAQYIKNHLSQAAKSVKLIRADRRFALTGTPIENRLSELWSIFDYLMPGLLYSYPQFRADFEIPVMKYEEEDTMDKLRGMVTPFILRRKKADVLKDLPDKLEEIRYARMDEEQKKLYDAQVVHMKMRLEKQSDEEFSKNKIEIFAELTRLRQICCDPALCFENYKKGSCKTDVFMDMIEQVIEGEHKALVFSQFVTMLDILKGRLESAGIPYYEITGATPKEKRIELVNAFNQDKTPVFLISLKAGGTGLNLTGADVVIHYDPWWNIAVQNQATDRAHRIGQRKVVTVFKLIAHGTIEDKILEMQEKKRALAENILESDGISSATLSRDDLLELLN